MIDAIYCKTINNILTWLGRQHFSNILLLIISTQLGYCGYRLVSHTLPEIHKESRINTKDLQESFIKERNSLIELAKEERKHLTDMYDSWFRRFSNINKNNDVLAEKH